MELVSDARVAEKVRWARLSIVSNVFLTALKLAVGLEMLSISVLSEAAHSGLDLLAAIIANVAVVKSARPPDREHAFGHGKFENLSAVAEAALILVAAGAIIAEAILRILNPVEVGLLPAGIAVMGVSALVNFAVSRKLFQIARRTESAALEADALHLSTDVWTSAGVLWGLVLIHLTGLVILDPILAILVAVLIVHAAWRLTVKSARELTDHTLPEEEMRRIRAVVERHRDRFVEFHGLRARKAGAERHIDLHVVMARDTHVDDAHELCDALEREIENELDGSRVLVHIEPCARHCPECGSRDECHAFLDSGSEDRAKII
ncbi:MAG: cation diffusion facilitator family transporter [Thermoplasmata archaeon]